MEQDGTFYRAILTFFLEKFCPFVKLLGKELTWSELDRKDMFPHENVYAEAMKLYNDPLA